MRAWAKVLQHDVRLEEQQGAGTMLLPAPGVYMSATFNLPSNIVLLGEAGTFQGEINIQRQ